MTCSYCLLSFLVNDDVDDSNSNTNATTTNINTANTNAANNNKTSVVPKCSENTTPRITTLSRWSNLCSSLILRALRAEIRVSLVGLSMPDWSRVKFQTKSDPWSSRLGVGRKTNNLLP